MELVEDTLDVDLADFLARRLFCFLAQVSPDGPRVSPLWFRWEDGQLWAIAQLEGRSYPRRVEANPETAVAVVDFAPARGRVQHVGMRGRATLEPYDAERGRRLLEKYLGPEPDDWPARFRGVDAEGYRLIAFTPETVVARDQSYAPPAGPADGESTA